LAQYFIATKEITFMAKKKVQAGDHSKKENLSMEKKKPVKAHDQADKDIAQDPDLTSKTNPEDKMDEGELARFEGED
jgi:hypothetical protein